MLRAATGPDAFVVDQPLYDGRAVVTIEGVSALVLLARLARAAAVSAVGLAVACSLDRPAAAPARDVAEEVAPPGRYADFVDVLRRDPELSPTLEDAERRRVQILVSVPSMPGQPPSIARHGFRVDAEYFYPASAVKLCGAVAALEKLEELRRERPDAGLDTPIRYEDLRGRTSALEVTLRQDLERALVVSDNDAYNRLFELVGREELGARIARWGLTSTRVVHRVGDGRGPTAPGMWLLGDGGPTRVSSRGGPIAPLPPIAGLRVGVAHVDPRGHLVPEPLDFSEKNRIGLRDLQDLLVAVTRPDLLDEQRAPRISTSDRAALLGILRMLPSETSPRGLPRPPRALDAQLKPLHAAVAAAMPDASIATYGKSGRAYGFTVVSSYIVDETTKRSAFVAIAMYTNDDETLNDDLYDYATVADPFVERIGHLVAREILARDE